MLSKEFNLNVKKTDVRCKMHDVIQLIKYDEWPYKQYIPWEKWVNIALGLWQSIIIKNLWHEGKFCQTNFLCQI